MREDQLLHLEEVCDDEVTLSLHGLLLNPIDLFQIWLADPDSTVGCLQHLRIVVAVTNRKDPLVKFVFGDFNHLRLLRG